MEIVLLMGILLLLGLAAFLLWKIHMLKQDIYGFTKNLDMALNIMLNGEKLESRPYSEDDLWGMIYERLRELSNMYTHKNKEISEEKELLKELVSDISHQTKTPIANVKLYLEMMGEDKENIPEYMKKLNLQVDKLDFLLQSMVKISRLETGSRRFTTVRGSGSACTWPARSSLCRTVILSWNPRQDKEVPSKFIFPIWIRKSHSFVIFSFCERFVIIMLYFYDIRIVRARSEQFCIIGL